ncbi:MAG TPA: HAD-IC family P-type ATPase, partial [Anaerolineae bacterium]
APAFEVDESLLTGERDSILKRDGDSVMSGSFCLAGSATVRATKVGNESYANKLTSTARTTKDTRTPLQRKIDFVVQGLVMVMAVIAILQLIAASNTGETPLRALRFTLVIVTSFVPAGLILAITVSLSVGAVRISQFSTLVQRINAIESMGNVTVLCADKTGTLTRNLLTVQQVIPLGSNTEATVKELLAQYVSGLNSQNKTAAAISAYCGAPQSKRAVAAEVAFSSARKWSALGFTDGRALILGSPEIIFNGQADAESILARSAEFTQQGLRVVAFLQTSDPLPVDEKTGESTLVIAQLRERQPVALVVIRDEIRDDIQETLKQFAELGVRVKVISGDNVETVQAIARRAGLKGDHVITESELSKLNGGAFDAAVNTAELFGRITPDTKQRIVKALTSQGEYVAMVGDGVNDVPALKQARLGIAMNDGAQIAKDVSDLVLLKNTLSTLPHALQEGQSITQKIYASAKLYLAKNVITIIAILFSGYVGLRFPGEPRSISWIAT